MIKSKLTTTIGIPAYNAEENIQKLIQCILKQKQNNFKLEKVFVYSDASDDKTNLILREIKSSLIELYLAPKRAGFANAVKKIIDFNNSDILIILNDDIIIKDLSFISKLVVPFEKISNVGLVCGNVQPFEPKTFIEQAINSGFRSYDKMRTGFNKGNTVLTVDGKSLGLSKQFSKSILFPKNLKRMGNVDGFLYFLCIEKGFKYYFAYNAKLFFKLPTNISDYLKWTIRNNYSKEVFANEFGGDISEQYTLPFLKYTYFRFVELFKNPLGATFLFCLNFYAHIYSKTIKANFQTKWDIVRSTKHLRFTS